MCKKLFSVVVFMIVLTLVGNALAATYEWDGGGETNLWNVLENWEPDGLPTSADEARVEEPNANCVIDSSVVAECSALYVNSNSNLEMTGGSLTMDGFLTVSDDADANSLMVISGGVANMGTVNGTNGRLRVAYRGIGTLIVTGGELNVYDKVEVGRQTGAVGYLYLYDGTINFSGNSSDLEIGTNGTGYVYQYGGVFNVQDNIKLTQNNADAVARLYLYGGVMTAGNLRDPEQVLGDALMDITEGMLVLPGDYTSIVNTYINNGWITAYDGLGELNVSYTGDPNETVISATPLSLEFAQKPNPANGAIEVPTDAVLSWRPGDLVETHNVYLGTDPNDVNEASVDDQRDVLVSQNQADASYDPGLLDYGQTYYWRVDEINDQNPDSPWKGDLWSFTVLNYPIVIDDFEDYNDYPPNEVWNTWIDGFGDPTNGSTAGYPDPDFNDDEHYVETEIVHSGLQSMPLFYDNAAGLSEVTRSLVSPMNNWTREGVVTLTLFYNGDEGNAAEPLYVALNGSAVVANEDLNAALVTDWTQWDIPLQAFADQGVNLANVSSISIGLGNKANPAAGGGSGVVYIDDIRLYLP